MLKRGRILPKFARAALAALSFALAANGAAAQDAAEQITLTRAQALGVAMQALEARRGDVAVSIARGLLKADPGDARAHLIIAAAARNAGRLDLAAEAATEAWRTADTPGERFDAAFIAGDIAARQERWTSAQIWLRRADQNAPSEQAEEIVARAYRGVSARNPLKVELSFSIRPSDNLNNGSDPDNETLLGGLTGSSEPKVSGIEASAGATLRFRISESAVQRTELFAQTYLRRAIMDSDDFDAFNASSFGPITRNEFDYASLAFGVGQQRKIFDGLGASGVRGTFGAAYYRNRHLSNFVELGVTQDVPAGDQGLVRFGLTLRDERRFDSEVASYLSKAASVDYFSTGFGASSYSLGATYTDFASDAPTIDGRQVQLRGRYALGRPIFGAAADVSGAVTVKDLPDVTLSDFSGTGRTDVTTRLALGVTYTDMTFYGFQPRIELTVSDTNSSDDFWDRRSFGLGATLVSRF